jgi:serine/threonine protein phosphatase PrpC
VGPARVWLRSANVPGLAMSRSMGDTVGKAAGVTSAPFKAVYVLQPHDRTLLLASDGLWDWVPNDEAAALSLTALDTSEVATRLARLARSRWLTRTGGADDTTVAVVRFNPGSVAR